MGNKTKIEIKELSVVYDVKNLPSKHVGNIYQKVHNMNGANLNYRKQEDKSLFSLRIEGLNRKKFKEFLEWCNKGKFKL